MTAASGRFAVSAFVTCACAVASSRDRRCEYRPSTHPAPRRAPRSGSGRRRSRWNTLPETGDEVVDGDPFLAHRITITDGDGTVVEGVEVDRDAVAAYPPRPGAGSGDRSNRRCRRRSSGAGRSSSGNLVGHRHELLVRESGSTADLERRQTRIEAEHGPLLGTTLRRWALPPRRTRRAGTRASRGRHRARAR